MNSLDTADYYFNLAEQPTNQMIDHDQSHFNMTEGEKSFRDIYAKQFINEEKMDWKNVDADELKMAKMLIEESCQYEGFSKISQVSSPQVSTCESNDKSESKTSSPQASLMDDYNPKEVLNKRPFDELNVDSEVEDDTESLYSPQADEEFKPKARKGKIIPNKRPTRRNSEDSITSFHSGSTKASEKIEVNFSPAQSGQNKMKNHQGTFSSRIKQECKADKHTGEDTRLFAEVTQHLSEEKKEQFRKYASLYQKNDKTWTSLIKYYKVNVEFGLLYVKMILRFLSSDFKNEYDEFIRQGKMNPESKKLLVKQTSKDFYLEKFTLVLEEIQGKACNFKEDIKKSRKSQKA